MKELAQLPQSSWSICCVAAELAEGSHGGEVGSVGNPLKQQWETVCEHDRNQSWWATCCWARKRQQNWLLLKPGRQGHCFASLTPVTPWVLLLVPWIKGGTEVCIERNKISGPAEFSFPCNPKDSNTIQCLGITTTWSDRSSIGLSPTS